MNNGNDVPDKRANGEGERIETDDDCAQLCRCLGPDEYEHVYINRYLSDSVFYTISYGTVCLQGYIMEQVDSILKSYGYQNLNDIIIGREICSLPLPWEALARSHPS